MGFSIPAAIGAKVGRPDRTVWAVDGDGCFQMTAQELVTASVERIPIKVALLNNSYLGMVRQWQEMFYDERYSEVYLSPDTPDYVRWAEAMGCVGIRVEDVAEVEPAIEKANSINDRPVVVEFRVASEEKVFPMVPAGASNDDLVLPPSQQAQAGSAAMTGDLDPAPHPVGARAEPARRAGPRRRAVRPARLQHLLARRRPVRARGDEPDHDRRRRRVGAARADHQAAVQAHRGRQDLRARPAPVGRAGAAARDRAGRRPSERSQVLELATIFEAKVLAVGFEALTLSLEGHPTSSTTSRSCSPPTASSSCSAPGASPSPSSSTRRPTTGCARAVKGKAG